MIAPIGVRAIGAGGLQHPHPHAKFWATQIFGAARETWGNQNFLQSFHVSFRLFFSLKELFLISSFSRRGKDS